ncbi:hypothetical protein M0R89_15980 [Halorussus limi]|uniref:Lipoprotein n=1 Tax=Halorussus limi TaxID=2938695 RepID=A0A8U0HTM6_9EURY|nr:hypothetical protein [Halorussus limi]UPV74024.1 hypothetical protein M0R89_15980 [Halorussus limi]
MRRALLALALAALLALAGCSSLTSQSDAPDTPEEPPVFRSVSVNNYDNQSHTVEVVVLHDGAVVHWATRRVAGKEENETLGTVVHSADVHPPEIENTTRRYTVLVRLDNRSSGERYHLPADQLSECYSVGAAIRDGELDGPIVHHWNDDLHDYCANPET